MIRPFLEKMNRSEILCIMIGGMVAMAPGRRRDIVALGPRTLVSGTLATLSCGCLAGMLL